MLTCFFYCGNFILSTRYCNKRKFEKGEVSLLVKLRGKRVEKGYRQKDLAKLLHISTNAYNLKESGKREFRMSEINMLLELLECKYEDIFLH